jgi:hypothetical protein
MYPYLKNITLTIIGLLIYQYIVAQQTNSKPSNTQTKQALEIKGIRIETDLGSMLYSALSTTKTTNNQQLGCIINISNKFYPTFEIGRSSTLKMMNDNSSFSTNGIYEKFGLDFRLNKPTEGGKPSNNLILLGLKLGMSSFNYSIKDLKLKDEYWGGESNINYLDQQTNKYWFEITGGIRVEVLKNTYIGWSVRYKSLLSTNENGSVYAWYIPGFGVNVKETPSWEFNYMIAYQFNIPKRINLVDKKTKIN